MPRKGEKLSSEHLAKMMAGRNAKKGGGHATAPGLPKDGAALTSGKRLTEPAEATKPMISQQPNLTKKKKANLVEVVPAVVRRKRGVQSSGVPASVQDATYIKDDYTGVSENVTFQLPGQAKAIQKALAVKVPKIVGQTFDPVPPTKTVDNIPSEDVKSLKVNKAAPFSMNALRQRLLC